MLSLQEAVQKDEVKQELKNVKRVLDTNRFHPDLASIYNVPSTALRMQLQETLQTIPLQEFLAKSGTTGIAGAAYMVPDKIHDELILRSKRTDICPIIGDVVTGWQGGDLKVDIVSDHTYVANRFTSGGQMQTETVETMQPTISPVSFGIAPRITNDLIEDANFGMVEFHLNKAALSMGTFATDLALTVLIAAADGWGTKNSATCAGTDTALWSEVVTAIKAIENDLHNPNTLLCTRESWYHSIKDFGDETAGGAAGDYWEFQQGYTTKPVAEGFDVRIDILDVLFSDSPQLHDSTDALGAAFTTCIVLIFDRFNSLLTGRKRWLQINNYSEPVRDLAGCTITARQDSVTLYDDAIYVLTEKT